MKHTSWWKALVHTASSAASTKFILFWICMFPDVFTHSNWGFQNCWCQQGEYLGELDLSEKIFSRCLWWPCFSLRFPVTLGIINPKIIILLRKIKYQRMLVNKFPSYKDTTPETRKQTWWLLLSLQWLLKYVNKYWVSQSPDKEIFNCNNGIYLKLLGAISCIMIWKIIHIMI